MEKESGLGDIQLIRSQNFSNKQEIFEYIKRMRENDFAYHEIQAAFLNAGLAIDETTIRIACN